MLVVNTGSPIQDVTSILSTLATIAGVVLAIIGFSTWKDQLKGKTNYDLARRYLRSVYRMRDAIKFVRNPFIPLSEIESSIKLSGINIDENDYRANQIVYNERWKKVIEAESDLKLERWEAEVSWGKQAIEIEKDFHQCIIELLTALTVYFDRDIEISMRGKYRDLIYDVGENDPFNKRMEQAILKIENFLSPHIK